MDNLISKDSLMMFMMEDATNSEIWEKEETEREMWREEERVGSICLGLPLLSWQLLTLLHTAAFGLPPAGPSRGVDEIRIGAFEGFEWSIYMHATVHLRILFYTS